MAYTTKVYFLTFLETRSSQIKVQQGWFLVRSSFLARRWLPFCCVLPNMAERVSELQGPLLIRAEHCWIRAYPYDLLSFITSLGALPPNSHIGGYVSKTDILGGHRHLVHRRFKAYILEKSAFNP